MKCKPKFNCYLGFICVSGSCIQVVNPKPKRSCLDVMKALLDQNNVNNFYPIEIFKHSSKLYFQMGHLRLKKEKLSKETFREIYQLTLAKFSIFVSSSLLLKNGDFLRLKYPINFGFFGNKF